MPLVPPDIQQLLSDESFAKRLPPMGNGARQLLAFDADEMEDPRLLALVAQKDPIHLGRLLSLANSATHARGGAPIVSADQAVRRIGTRESYVTLLACATAASFSGQDDANGQRRYLLNYTVSVCLTAKKLANWLKLDDHRAGRLALGCLLVPTGLYAGLLARQSPVSGRFARCLAEMNGGADLRQRTALAGFASLSALVATQWSAPPAIRDGLLDFGRTDPHCEDGQLLAAVEALVHAKATGADQWMHIQVVESSLPLPSKPVPASVDIGVFVT